MYNVSAIQPLWWQRELPVVQDRVIPSESLKSDKTYLFPPPTLTFKESPSIKTE